MHEKVHPGPFQNTTSGACPRAAAPNPNPPVIIGYRPFPAGFHRYRRTPVGRAQTGPALRRP